MDEPNPFQPLMDDIFREKVRRARLESPEQKLVDGLDLFEEALTWMRVGVRGQFSRHDEAQVEAEVHRRIARIRQVEEHGIYQPVPRP